ncbi:Hypothetical predicted protein [Argonauta hians]
MRPHIIASFLLIVVCFNIFAEAMALNEVLPKSDLSEISKERLLANRLLHRLLDVAYETFRDYGGTEHELKEIQRKRAVITACYFQAVSCY